MDFDDMLVELGELGKFQITTYILVCIPVFFGAANSLSYVFTAGIPNYRCFISECEQVASTSYRTPWLDWAIPKPERSHQVVLDSKSNLCDRFSINTKLANGTCFKELFTEHIEQCSEWVFGEERTIVNEWNLTCSENQWKLSFVGTTHFAGIVVGSALFGILADRYGRKKILVLSIFVMSISGVAQVVSPDYTTFTLMMFINAMGTSGIYPLAFIIGVEMVGKKKREITGIVLNYFYALGEAIVAPIAWYTQDWIILQLIVSAPAILFCAYYWSVCCLFLFVPDKYRLGDFRIIPESVRWLLANEKREKARGIVFRVAKVNNVTLSESLVDSFKENIPLTHKGDVKIQDKMLPIVKQILKSNLLIIRYGIVYFIWAVNAFVFYGLSVNSTSMSGNKYINFALVSLVEIPGYTMAWISIRILGRRPSLVLSLLLCGLTCTLTIFVPTNMFWGVIVLFLIGKLGITSAFGIVYVHTAEMLPTVIRSGGVGSASTVARIGALLAPFVPLLGFYYKPLPMLLFGGVAVIAGLLALKLPETLGVKLPETVREAEKMK